MKNAKKILSVLIGAMLSLAWTAFAAAANLPGDVSGDGKVTAEDARLCLRQAVGLEAFAPASDAFIACDVTSDGTVTAEDARLILRAAVGLETLGEEPSPVPDYTANNEYDILRSGTFYLTGSMTDSEGVHPLEMATGKDLIYMLSDMEGQQIAMQVLGNDFYMIHVAKNTYHKLDKATMNLLGLDIAEIKNNASMGDLPALSEADSVVDGLLDSAEACKIYTFIAADGGRTQIYMNGDRLLGIDSFTANWVRTQSMRMTSVTKDLPEKVTKPGGGGRPVLLITFMGYFV